jgi:hypothetical protein
MPDVLVYGSLLAPHALDTVFGSHVAVHPVVVDGYRRCCTQRSDVREPDSGRTVLTAVPDDSTWLNALWVRGVSDRGYDRYVERESGYELIPVAPEALTPYEETVSVPPEIELRLAVGTLPAATPNPIPAYIAECLDGAAMWGDTFRRDFLLQTFRE